MDKVVKEFNDSRENHVKAAAAKEAAQNTLKDAVLAMEEIRAGYQTAITEGGFADESEYLSAKRSKEQIAQMEKEIAKYQQELVAAKALYQKAAQDAEGLVPVDLTPLQQELEGLQREIGALNDRRSLLYNRRDRNGEILKYIQARKIALDRKEEQYSEINELNKVANGNNEQRISFERYVLAAFFQDVIAAANLRLDKMTGGRYEMRRIGERRRGGGQSGLELEVMDYYTGQARHVKTLSGGEGFKASLALALGLADVVQSYAGGVSLETMFVDEGFGTLDPESLDSAIDCLVDLQHSGRLVGIISHVPELKDKVDARLEVQAGKTGSVAQFVVG